MLLLARKNKVSTLHDVQKGSGNISTTHIAHSAGNMLSTLATETRAIDSDKRFCISYLGRYKKKFSIEAADTTWY